MPQFSVARATRVVRNYAIAPLLGRPTTAAFWYIPEPPRIRDAESLAAYLDPRGGSPFYPIDFRQKCVYNRVNSNGIIVLPYDPPVRDQINPEAAFQYALGLHDRYIETREETELRRFLHYAEYFRGRQTEAGDWTYDFDWFTWRAPWSSALAQSRGASVMLRAWMITGTDGYLAAAQKAISKFEIPVEQGGYLATFAPTSSLYYEEYPDRPTCAFNGFLAAVIAPWEMARWTNDNHARKLWDIGIASICAMLPHFTTSWWTVYDFDPESPVTNYHSPRYHRMCTGYLTALAHLSNASIIDMYASKWDELDRLSSRLAAYAAKLYRKAAYH